MSAKTKKISRTLKDGSKLVRVYTDGSRTYTEGIYRNNRLVGRLQTKTLNYVYRFKSSSGSKRSSSSSVSPAIAGNKTIRSSDYRIKMQYAKAKNRTSIRGGTRSSSAIFQKIKMRDAARRGIKTVPSKVKPGSLVKPVDVAKKLPVNKFKGVTLIVRPKTPTGVLYAEKDGKKVKVSDFKKVKSKAKVKSKPVRRSSVKVKKAASNHPTKASAYPSVAMNVEQSDSVMGSSSRMFERMKTVFSLGSNSSSTEHRKMSKKKMFVIGLGASGVAAASWWVGKKVIRKLRSPGSFFAPKATKNQSGEKMVGYSSTATSPPRLEMQ